MGMKAGLHAVFDAPCRSKEAVAKLHPEMRLKLFARWHEPLKHLKIRFAIRPKGLRGLFLPMQVDAQAHCLRGGVRKPLDPVHQSRC